MDEKNLTSQTESVGQESEAEIEDLEVGAEADRVAGGLRKSGDPEDGGN
jgi:hypothetical protein